ncbi:MAG: response regulator [Myxococcota bacterium]
MPEAAPRSRATPPIRFVKSLSGRMLLLGVLPTAVVLAGIIVWLALAMYSALRSENEHGMRILADRVAAEIERGNTRAVLVAQVMAAAQTNGLFGDRPASVAYARQVLKDFPELTGAYFGYEPNADGQDAGRLTSASPIEALSEDGRFIPYWFRDYDDNALLRLEPLVDMETSLYYQGCKELFLREGRALPMVTEPYVYVGKMIVEQTFPIVIDGEFKGIAGVDRALSDIVGFLREIATRDAVDLFLISRSGRFVAATTESPKPAPKRANAEGEPGDPLLRTRAILDTPYARLLGPFHEQRTERSFQLAADPIDGGRHYYVSAPIPTGEWLVVLRKDEASVVAPIRDRLAAVILLIALGLSAVLAISLWITTATSRRIRRTVEAADRLAEGDVSVDTKLLTDSQDETGRLAEAFNRVVESYREITRMCVAIAEGDFSRSFPRRSESDALADALNEMSEKRRLAEEAVRSARDAAEEANHAKSAFLAKMSHELRTPMNAIIGYSEMLEEEAEDLGQDDFIPDLKKIQAAGRHLLALINDILDLSKVEAGKMGVYLERFSVPAVIEEVVSTIQPLVTKNANELTVRCPPGVGEMVSDLVKLRQGLFNLLSNACKFTQEGTIELAVERRPAPDGDRVIFSVTDSGIGMTPEQMERIFEAFSQADSSTTRQFGGTGLGLTITRRFAELLGGEVGVTSEPGVGSTFTIELPAEAEPEPLLEEAGLAGEESETSVGESGRPLVLVIDDDPGARDLLTRRLVREGFSVTTAASGEEGLRRARDSRPAAITLDVLMPGMNGWAVLRELKADPQTADIPVVVVSLLQDGAIAYALGAEGFLAKPIQRDELRSLLAGVTVEGRRVLVVEDDEDARNVLVHHLEREGWHVRSATNGREGLDRMAEERPDLVLLDLMMPVMDGFDFIRAARQDPGYRQVPIIVVTAKELTREEELFLAGSTERLLEKADGNVESVLDEITGLLRGAVEGTRRPPAEPHRSGSDRIGR